MITAIAIPRSSHSDAVLPAATTMFDAKTIQFDASETAEIGIISTKKPGKHTCKAECDCLNCKDHCNQELRLAIDRFEINLFSSTAWHHTAEL